RQLDAAGENSGVHGEGQGQASNPTCRRQVTGGTQAPYGSARRHSSAVRLGKEPLRAPRKLAWTIPFRAARRLSALKKSPLNPTYTSISQYLLKVRAAERTRSRSHDPQEQSFRTAST